MVTRFSGTLKPHLITFDEGLYAQIGCQLKENPVHYTSLPTYRHYLKRDRFLPDYLKRPIFKHPPVFCYLISFVYRFAGSSYPAAVWVSILAGAMLVVVTYLIARQIFNPTTGIIAAFLLTIDPVHWLCSEKIWIEMTFTLFFYLAILFFILTIKKDKLTFFIACGIFIGLSILTKYPGVLLLPIIFSYFYLYRPELLLKIKSYLLLLIPILMFIPWMAWNYYIYKAPFFVEMLSAHHSKYKLVCETISNPRVLLFSVPVLLVSAGFFLLLRIKVKKSALFFNYSIFALILGCFLSIFILPGFRGSLANMIDLFHIPQAGWKMGMFKTEPWYFYFMRLIELSPFYLFSFMGLLFFLKQKREARLLFLTAAWVMAAFIMLRNFQSRYILPAIPALLILAGDMMVKIWEGLKVRIESKKILIFSQAFLILLIVFFLLKTLAIDLKLAVPNWPCYF